MGVTDIDCIVAATADQSDSAAFRSVEAALRFAYGQRHRGEPDKFWASEAGVELGTQFDRAAGEGER